MAPAGGGVQSAPAAESVMFRSVPLCPEEELPESTGRHFLVDGREIAVFRLEGRFYALDGRCPHQGGPLGHGELVGGSVMCPWHGWTFDLATGRCDIVPDASVACFPVRVENGMVVVDLA